jgi:hypothetical protein
LGQIDSRRELIDIAIEMNIIVRKGAWYAYEDSKWNGMGAIELTDKQIKAIEKQIKE